MVNRFSMPSVARLAAMALALVAPAVVGAAPAPGVSDSQIVIGQNITLQSGNNAYGTAVQQGIKVYFDAVNASGGVHGRKLVLQTLDDDNKSAQAEANARKLVDQGVFVLFGSIEGGPSTAVMKVAREASVPFVGPMAGSPTLRRPHQPMVFPVRAEHREEFRALMTWGRSVNLKSVGFFHSDDANGQEHLNNVQLIAKELGMEVVLPVPFKSDLSDAQLDEIATQITRRQPDLFFNHGSAGLYSRLVAKAKAAGAKTNFTAVNSGSSQIARSLGRLATGMVFAQVVPSPWERKHEITREYQDAVRRTGADVDFSYGSLEGYLTAKALVMALRAAGRDLTRAALVRALETGSFDLGGIKVTYGANEHLGSRFVDLSMIGRDGRFIH